MAKKILIVLLILTLAFIWGHSLMPVEVSQQESWWVTDLLTPFLEPVLGEGNVTDHFVRKLAHFSEYTVLGLELGLLLAAGWKGRLHAGVLGFICAFLDESIQMLSGRGDQIIDVWLDLSGAVFGVLLAAFIRFLIRRAKCRKP